MSFIGRGRGLSLTSPQRTNGVAGSRLPPSPGVRPPFWESNHPACTPPSPHIHTPPSSSTTLLRGLTMVHTCVVAGCRNRRTPGTSLPRDWIAVSRAGWGPRDGGLCSTRFVSGTWTLCACSLEGGVFPSSVQVGLCVTVLTLECVHV